MDDLKDFKKKQENFRKRFYASGIQNFTPQEKLEFLMLYGMPHKNGSDIAEKLISICGSLSSVMDAPYDLLTEHGITENAAVLIKMVPQVSRIYLDDKHKIDDKTGKRVSLEYKMVTGFIGAEGEQVELALLDKKGKELYLGVVNKGSITASEINLRTIAELAIHYRASIAYIAHNHPSGIAYPSGKDIEATIRLRDTLSAVNVRLCDHYIVANSESFSMANNEEFFDIFLH